jgi:hypothetical protein
LFDQPHEARRVVREAPTWLASSNWTVVDRARWAMNRCWAGSMARSSAQAAYRDRTRRSWPPLGLRREVPPVVLRTARRRAIRAEHCGWLLRKGVRPRCPLAPSGSSPPCGAAPRAASQIRSAVDAGGRSHQTRGIRRARSNWYVRYVCPRTRLSSASSTWIRQMMAGSGRTTHATSDSQFPSAAPKPATISSSPA